MKNTVLRSNMGKSMDEYERIFMYNEVLELIKVNKIQRGSFDEFVGEMVTGAGPECKETGDEYDGGCNLTNTVVDRRFANATGNNWNKFLCAGYKDCMDEAIRYLVEVEKISPEQPVVQNLKIHLQESKKRILDGASHFDCRPNAQNKWLQFSATEDATSFSPISVSHRFSNLERKSSFSHQHFTNYEFPLHNYHLFPLNTIVKLLKSLQTN